MDPASIAAALIGSQTGQAQIDVGMKMLKMNADRQTAVAQMIASVAQSASLPPGVGKNLDIAA
jgi:hypothetical protein